MFLKGLDRESEKAAVRQIKAGVNVQRNNFKDDMAAFRGLFLKNCVHVSIRMCGCEKMIFKTLCA